MKQVVIENPVINSPFEEPRRHFKFTEEGITDEVVDGRRISEYFIPIPRAEKKNAKRLSFATECTLDRLEENEFINCVRERVATWRKGGSQVVAKSTCLLEYWRQPERERKLFFCQIEALEMGIYITEVASKYGDAWIEDAPRSESDESAWSALYQTTSYLFEKPVSGKAAVRVINHYGDEALKVYEV